MSKIIKSPKVAVCVISVPAVLSGTGRVIAIRTKVEYVSIKFRNGEHHLMLSGGTSIPAIFFAV